MVEDYKKYYYGRTDMIMLNDEKVYGSLGINLKEVTTIVEGYGSVVLHNSLKKPFRKFELIGNSVQGENPSPDNPQEIKSAGRKSKNLFNIADLRVGQVQKDGTINEKQIYYRTVILDVPQDGKYRITFAENNDYNMLYFAEMYTNGVYSQPYVRVRAGNPNHYITLAKGKNILSFSTHAASGSIDFTTDHNIMIAAESETLDYEPYGYLLDVKVTGRNILSDVKGMHNIFVPCSIKAGTTVTLITNGVESDGGNILFTTDSGEDYWYAINKGVTKVARSINKNVIGFKNLLQKKDGLKYCLTIGENDKYEPYTEQSMQIALNEPLRGIGEYKDTITKDGVVRKIKRTVFDGSEDEKWGIGIERENVIDFVSTQFSDATKINEHQRSMMDKLKWLSGVWGRDEIGQDMFARILRINMPKTLTPDLQTFKTWLSQNPLTVDYVLETPITEPLPESVQQQLQALHTENGVTHIFVDSGEVEAGIKVEYVVGA